jgi:hypothetical protein
MMSRDYRTSSGRNQSWQRTFLRFCAFNLSSRFRAEVYPDALAPGQSAMAGIGWSTPALRPPVGWIGGSYFASLPVYCTATTSISPVRLFIVAAPNSVALPFAPLNLCPIETPLCIIHEACIGIVSESGY